MKGVNSWSFAPYKPLLYDTGDIYICRIVPGVCSLHFEWLPGEGDAGYTVYLRVRGTDEYEKYETAEPEFTKNGLSDETDYEFYVASGEKKSRVRLARTGFVPGDVVVNYLHPEDNTYAYSGHYLCSPSLLRLPDGALLASMDVYEGDRPQDLSLVFRSEDNGKTWKYMCDLFPCFWGKLFLHRGRVYMLAVNTEYGDLLIGCSEDGGRTFSAPTVLLRGSSGFSQKGVHKNPQPVVSYNGRLYETLEWGSWRSGTHAAMSMSIDESDDPMIAENWHFTPPVPYDPDWEGTAKGNSPGCIEGCIVEGPDGELYNVMRYQIGGCVPAFGRAVVMKVGAPDEPQRFDRVIDFPGNHSKFMIKRDPVTGKYVSLASYLTDGHPEGRNWLALLESDDLWHWKFAASIFDYRDSDPNAVGFQYVDFFIEGGDILYLSRTAFNRAHNFHDANYSVFGRVKDFRKLL